jgi:ATP-dependent DNA helicase RecQ
MRRSLDLAEGDHEALEVAFEAQLALLRDMQRLCVTVACRHRLLCAYFGQTGPSGSCGACDCCLGEIELLRESTLAARQILSAVARTGQRFGVGHVADVLRGVAGERIRELGHDQLSVFGLMRDRATEVVRHLIHQHVDHGLLVSTGGDRPTLALAPEALPVLRGEVEVTLVRPRLGAKATRSAVAEIGMRGVDRELFDSLRALRRGIAERIGKPPYVVFGDETLREMARVRPATVEGLRTLRGIGAKKLRDYGDAFFAVIDEACRERGLGRDMQDSDGRSGR